MPAAAAPTSRMSLANVKSSRCVQPYRTLVFGAEKVGKTTFIAKAPGAIALDIEGRMGHIDVPKFPTITSWQEALDALETLRVEKHDYKNVLIDSVSALEKHVKVEVMNEGDWSATEADEYGRWLKVAISSYWPRLFTALERLERERNMGVLMTAHMAVKNMKNPGGEPYDRFRPALGGQEGPQLFLHHVHDVLYATHDDVIRLEKKGGRERVRTSTTGNRVLYTQHTPAYDAGNSCGLPPCIEMDFDFYARLREEGLAPPDQVKKTVIELLAKVKDADTVAKAKAYLDANASIPENVRPMIGRLREIIDKQERAEEAASAATAAS